jgi:hypothetical protein
MKDSMRNIKRVAEDGTGPLKKRPHRQGKPLRKRAKRVALPDGRFRCSDEQWHDVGERFGFPSDARYRMEITITIYRNNLAEEADAVPPSITRQNLQRLAMAGEKLCSEFERVINDDRAWELITNLRNWPALRVCRLERDLLDLPDAATKAAHAVQLGPPGAAVDSNILGFVNTLAPLWEEYTGTRFDRTKRRPNAADFIIAVGLIADPQVHSATWENVVRSVAENRYWEN